MNWLILGKSIFIALGLLVMLFILASIFYSFSILCVTHPYIALLIIGVIGFVGTTGYIYSELVK